jgi:hypothetical protein
MRARRRKTWRTRTVAARMRRRIRSRASTVLKTTGDVVRLFGWLYLAVLVPALAVVSYLVVREAATGGDVLHSLHMFPLAMIWPVAAIALRSDATLALTFPLNALVLVGAVALVLTGWSVLIRLVRDLIRLRAAR